jgi:AcrR family transcriptional regulator
MGRPREHNEKTATALLEAAERSIEKRGVDALSVRSVAADVGVSTRAVYSLFGSKEGLIVALAVRAFDNLGSAIGDLPTTDDPKADLISAGLEFRRFATEHPSMFGIGVQRTARLPSGLWAGVREAARRAVHVLEQRITRMRAGGMIGDRSVQTAALEFHAYCEGMAALELRGRVPPDGMTMEQLWVNGLTALLHGFGRT